MAGLPHNLLPLGDFLPSDKWQTHVNAIFYGTLGSGIHDHFQTYVSRDYRLAYSLAEEFYRQAVTQKEKSNSLFVLEWGVGNGNLASSFLDRLKEIDEENIVYPRIKYVLCDFSPEILKAVINNPRLQTHQGRFSAIRVDAESMRCFKPNSVFKIISNEICYPYKLKNEIYDACKTIVHHEDAFIDLAFQMGPLNGLTAEEVKQYIRFIGNRRLEQLGLNPIYDVKKNPLTWLDTMLNGVEHMNFFEGRATEYSKASTKGSWGEVFA